MKRPSRVGGSGRSGNAAGVSALLLVVLAQAGCYERVVRARGIGTDRVEVYESNRSNAGWENWLMGEEKERDPWGKPGDR